MRTTIALLACSLLGQLDLQGQARSWSPDNGISFGLGIGLDHGGFGVRMDAPLAKGTSFVAGFGSAIVGLGWNVGVVQRFIPHRPIRPYVTALYGYNAVIFVKGMEKYDRIYLGPSVGAGVEFGVGRGANFLRLGAMVPFRSDAYAADSARMKADPLVQVQGEPGAVLVSLGYHFHF